MRVTLGIGILAIRLGGRIELRRSPSEIRGILSVLTLIRAGGLSQRDRQRHREFMD